MGKKIIWSRDALEQLEDIHFYIFFESKSIQIADKVINAIFESTKILKIQPAIYELDSQKNNNNGSFRSYHVYNYTISYQTTLETVLILRVRHNSRKPKFL
jgi:plasmid stabilization system protein ParE